MAMHISEMAISDKNLHWINKIKDHVDMPRSDGIIDCKIYAIWWYLVNTIYFILQTLFKENINNHFAYLVFICSAIPSIFIFVLLVHWLRGFTYTHVYIWISSVCIFLIVEKSVLYRSKRKNIKSWVAYWPQCRCESSFTAAQVQP